ncbi:MAG: glycoside hydrolase family 44 protein [Acidimicrobiales bacterium]
MSKLVPLGLAAALVVPLLGAATARSGPKTATVNFVIDTAKGQRAISPLIYGINADKSVGSAAAFNAVMAETRPGLVRTGGNRWTAYNWENNDSNAGSDYEFENDDYLTPSTKPAAAVVPTVKAAEAEGATALVTVPIAGYVSADRNPPGSVENSGPDYLSTRFRIDEPDEPGGPTLTPNLKDKYVYQDQFVYVLHHEVPNEPIMFSLDNEPDLWDSTHSEIHPLATTYAELLAKDLEYAKAVKSVLPNALVTGPVSYGWEGYLTLQNAPDSAADGDFLDWWMKQVKLADKKAGKTLINDLDLHWYPEATGGGVRITGTDTTPAVVAAREQAPRSLWDKSYVEDSWITQDTLDNKGIDLIPRLQGMVKKYNPGMNLDFSEWNYGGGQSISGGIATADVLGIFGRYGVHASAVWPLNSNESYTFGAFALYRNYNGKGASFGNTEVSATTSNKVDSSVYASIDKADPDHVVIVVINKGLTATPTTIDLDGGPSAKTAAVYTLTSASSTPRAATGLKTSTNDKFSYTMPAQSVSVIVPATSGSSTASRHSPGKHQAIATAIAPAARLRRIM